MDHRLLCGGLHLRTRDRKTAAGLHRGLARYEKKHGPLAGITLTVARETLIEQLVESIRRTKYVRIVGTRQKTALRADPTSSLFDPLMGASVHAHNGDLDEALWLLFLATHFGKSQQSKWLLVADIYGGLSTTPWNWRKVSADPNRFTRWLAKNERAIKQLLPLRRFSNHRKYQSLSAIAPTGTGAAITSYVTWVQSHGGHAKLIDDAKRAANADRRGQFDLLYKSMQAVMTFGRTARFDYLVLAGELGIVDIEPGKAYLVNATGPLAGARALFRGDPKAATSPITLEANLSELDDALGVGFHVLEDALCNWQKSPTYFIPFRG